MLRDFLLKSLTHNFLGIGKSCILTRLTKDHFDTEHNVTVGVDFGSCLMKVEDTVLKLQIWDTAGQESFRSITKIFYRSADAVILGYSIADRATFDNLSAWMREVREQCYPDVMLFLVGNKSDLESERRVSRAMAQTFAKENGIKYFMETSAKSGVNVNKLFFDCSKFLYNQIKNHDHGSDTHSSVSGSISRSTYDQSAFGSRQLSGNFATLNGQYVDDNRLQLND